MTCRVATFAVLAVILAVQPLYAMVRDNPPASGGGIAGTQELPSAVCPADRTDGPLYADGRSYYGIPAQRIVEGFLASPREGDAWRNVSVSSVRVLTDDADYDACLRLTTIITGGVRNSPPPQSWVYFTAGGFYFVSQWKPAQALSNYTTSYGYVMVYDSTFNLLGAFAF
ncbi:MAG TPA: hypothetical protein VGX50_03820 [Longimicrobium sp.]|jgi:hypothetical protein|nr:hypothetical protein [Longimicrobium sp.]